MNVFHKFISIWYYINTETKYNSLIVNLPNSHLNKSKSETKNEIGITLILSSNMCGSTNDETNFHNKLLLTHKEASKLRKAFSNNVLANLKLLKTQLFKIIQSGRFLSRLPGPLLKGGLPVMKAKNKSN